MCSFTFTLEVMVGGGAVRDLVKACEDLEAGLVSDGRGKGRRWVAVWSRGREGNSGEGSGEEVDMFRARKVAVIANMYIL
ncbi:hypothetical protein Tco_0737666 [Tanacetum coccineum]